MHQINDSESAVRTFKNHFIAYIFTVDPLFPFYLWDRLVPQVTMTLNMLRLSRIKPELSSYEQVDEIHNFERRTLTILGCKVKIHEKSHKQLTYAPHSVGGWYLVPSFHHYRFYTFYNIETRGDTTPDTIAFLPEFMKILNYGSRDMAIYAAADMAKALKILRPESHFQVVDSQLKEIR